jgi:hypothetical protein
MASKGPPPRLDFSKRGLEEFKEEFEKSNPLSDDEEPKGDPNKRSVEEDEGGILKRIL